MGKYRVAQVGCGPRGIVHIDGWLDNPDRFELVALCELDRERMERAVADRGITPAFYDDADTMLAETEPDVFCFSTQPTVRLSMVELAARHGVAGLAFEKPMARSVGEARQIAVGGDAATHGRREVERECFKHRSERCARTTPIKTRGLPDDALLQL